MISIAGPVAAAGGITGFGGVWTLVAFAATLLALAGLFLRVGAAWPWFRRARSSRAA